MTINLKLSSDRYRNFLFRIESLYGKLHFIGLTHDHKINTYRLYTNTPLCAEDIAALLGDGLSLAVIRIPYSKITDFERLSPVVSGGLQAYSRQRALRKNQLW